MTKLTQKVLIDTELLQELVDAQYSLIYEYKIRFGDRVHCGRWNQEVNEAIEKYNKAAGILGIKKMELVPHD